MSIDDKELLNDLVLDCKEHLANIEPDLLLLEKEGENVSLDLVNRLFRAMHSIKGGFAFFGLVNIATLAHSMESVLMKVRDGKMTVSAGMVDALLDGMDKLSLLINQAEESPNIPIQEQLDKLKPLMDAEAAMHDPIAPQSHGLVFDETADNETEITEDVISDSMEAAATEIAPVSAKIIPAEPAPLPKIVPAQPKPAIEVSTPVIAKPVATAALETQSKQHSGAADSIRVKVELLNRLMNLAGELVLARNRIVSMMNLKPLELLGSHTMKEFDEIAETAHESIIKALTQDQRFTSALDKQTMDDLRLTITREFGRLKDVMLKIFSMPMAEVSSVKTMTQQINLVTTDLQENIMRTRLQPCGAVFSKLPRVMRDLSKNLGKQIKLETVGDDVELDKSIIETLGDPLTHIIRNCADHAIEMPIDRERAGKSPEGFVLVRAYYEGDQVNIEIKDDGKGLDPEALKAKAVEKMVITREQAAKMSEAEAQALIFMPGFSTAKAVTDVSGRGVGMDVVKTNIENIGGTVEIMSAKGVGTTIRFKLPLTMAIIPALLVMSSNRRFAIPQASVEELIRISASDVANEVHYLHDSVVLKRHGKLLPLVRLSDVFDLKRMYYDPKTGELREDNRTRIADRRSKPISLVADMLGHDSDDELEAAVGEEDMGKREKARERRNTHQNALKVVGLKVGKYRFGLIVDALLNNEEIVVKPLSRYFKGAECYAGAVILGDGDIAMLLDPSGIANRMGLRFSEVERENAAREQLAQRGAVDMQNLLIFSNGQEEVFAMNIDLIARIDKINRSQIERVGQKEFIKHDDKSIRVLRLHHYLPVSAPLEDPDECYVIIPKLVRHPMGIVVNHLLDIAKSEASLDKDTITGTGILGSAVLNGKITLFVDIYSMFEQAEPEIYKRRHDMRKLEGKKILLAEDTAFFRFVTVKYLEEMGCHVDAAQDGVIAWEKLTTSGHKYDLLLTDVMMPRMGGLELTRKVRSSPALKDIPIVTLTSMGSKTDIQKGMEAGVTAYETKLDKERLMETLTRILAN